MSIIKLIKNFKQNKRTLFTTPSHSQGEFVPPDSTQMLGSKFYSCDYSEIEGFDNLANPIGQIKLLEDEIAKIYRAKDSFLLTNGSSSGIVTAMLALLKRNEKVLIARNCHKSVYNGLVVSGAIPIWIMPHYNKEWGVYESINVENFDEILKRNSDIKLFIMTNPTYEGYMSDIQRISEVCKKYGVRLLVDEAHGALWNFHKSMGTPSLLQGADVVVQSLHKTAGALNPCALLHIGCSSDINPKVIQQALNIITTTSPSYPLLLNIESTVNFLNSGKGKNQLSETIKNVNRLIRSLKTLPNIEIYANNNDVTKILVKVTNISGFELSDILFDKYKIEDELANEKSVLFLTGMGTTKGKLQKLEKALMSLCADNIKITENEEDNKVFGNVEPRVRYTPSVVWGANSSEVDLKFSLSRICMEVVCDYPPGVPILLPGEVIKKEHIEFLSKKRNKIKVLV